MLNIFKKTTETQKSADKEKKQLSVLLQKNEMSRKNTILLLLWKKQAGHMIRL